MRMASVLVVVLGATLGWAEVRTASAQMIEVTGGAQASTYVPVTLAYDGDASPVTLIDSASGDAIPATVRNGELTFVLDALAAGATRTFRIENGSVEHALTPLIGQRGGAEKLEVQIGDKLFTSYYYSNEEKKPYLWPVNTVGGKSVTRDWPLGEADRSKDHPHHKSLWTAYGDLNGADCWGEGSNAGYQRSGEVTWGSGAAYGWIHAKNVWTNNADEPVIDEEREYRFYATPEDARLMDVEVTFRANYGDVKFGDTKEGGLVGVRMADALCEKGGNGTITNSVGGVGARETWGKPAAWCDYSGTLEGAGACGLTVFDHPTNLRHPTSWHVRDYGLMGANCFGYSYFTNKAQNGDLNMKSGDSITFRYRVYVHAGDVETSHVAERYSDYSKPPVARWTN